MAKQRIVNTLIWDDEYFSHLDPSEKLLFIYLITNSATNISGIYQIQEKRMAADTGIDKDMCIKIIARFEKDNKIKYHNGWVAIKNFIKHQNNRSPKIQQGIQNEIKNAPQDLREWVLYGIDTVSHININPNINIVPEKNIHSDVHNSIKAWFEKNNQFYYHDKKQAGTISNIIKKTTHIKQDVFTLLETFKILIESDDKYYSQLALIPSVFLGHIDSVLKIKTKPGNSYREDLKKLYGNNHLL